MDQRFEEKMINVIVDEHLDKKKVVWVLSGNDFVDLLYSYLTIPLGTIVRLLDCNGRYRPEVMVGCLNNLYKSVVDMNIDNFQTEACKQMLVYPKSVKEVRFRRLKINIDDAEETKYLMCPMSLQRNSCCKFFSNFNTSRCSCGNLMNKEIPTPGEEEESCYDYDGVFVNGDGNVAFMVSDDLKIDNFSLDLLRKKLKDSGCINGLDEFNEGEAEIGFQEARTLLRSLFTSETPLTTALSPLQSQTNPSMRTYKPSSPCDPVLGQVLSLKVFLSKQDKRKVVYVECGGEFIDLLCTFLVLPLEYVCEISSGSNDDGLGCIANLFRSFKGISRSKVTIPWYYSCRKNLLGITIQNPPILCSCEDNKLKKVRAMDPKTEMRGQSRSKSGLMKKDKKFIVSDDLRITPSDLTMNDMKRFKIGLDDVKIEEITIGRTEAINLLKASFATSTALTNSLSDMLAEKLQG